MSDEELKHAVRKGNVVEIGDIVTCKQLDYVPYSVTRPGVELAVQSLDSKGRRQYFYGVVIDETHDEHGYGFSLSLEDFELVRKASATL